MRALFAYVRAWFSCQWERFFTTAPAVEEIGTLELFLLSYHPETLQIAAYSSDRLREREGRWKLPTIAEIRHISDDLRKRIEEGEFDSPRPEHVYIWAFDMRRAAFVGYCPFREGEPGSIIEPNMGFEAADEEALDALDEEGEGWMHRRRKAEISKFYAVSVREAGPRNDLRRHDDK